MTIKLPQLNYKKIFIILGFIFLVVILVYIIIFFFFTDKKPEDTALDIDDIIFNAGRFPDSGDRVPGRGVSTGPDGTGTFPQADLTARGSFTQVQVVTEYLVKDPRSASGGIVYYDPREGYFYRQSDIDSDNKTLLTDEKFFEVQSVAWSPNQSKAVIEFPDGSNILYDFTKRHKITLPSEIEDPVFTERSDQLVYKTKTNDDDFNWLVVSDSDGGNARFVEPLSDNVDFIQVEASPDSRVVAFYGKPTGLSSSEVLLLGQNGENFKSMKVTGLNYKGKYSPDGKRLIYHVVSPVTDYNPLLWVADGRAQSIGQKNFNLGIITWVDKCVFSFDSRFLYCAVASELPSGAGIDPDLFAHDSTDTFFKIDLDTGLKQQIAIPIFSDGRRSFSVESIWLSEDESELVFWDFHTGGVYKVRLR